ncbi:hypothetical protein J3R30DRAFT_1411567 [Lentinula aciculospora]|uniref:Uncharacterized protein n=1 Tax=Lentinula aciculospora TaxID=153920 RepID=A0A9W9ALL1_9AGAR|nr:hypothetical protein J3R30DRAFT_1411567 [Lentinula aciculospora]
MLSSLFTKKTQTETGAESLGLVEATEPEPNPTVKGPLRSLTAGIYTPHDAALAELYAKPPEQSIHTEEDLTAPGSASPTSPGAAASSHTAPREVIRDPFNGQIIGTLGLPDPNLNPEAHIPLSDAAGRNEEIWCRLSTVLDLQSQIAALHLEMEGIGDQGKGKGKGNRVPNISKRPPVRAASGTAELLDLEHDEGVGVGDDEDEEQRKDREREEDFARLTDQFEGRKEGVKNIMSKLDELSKALTEFHALQAPNIDFPSSRQSSLPVVTPTSSIQGIKSPVPLPPIISIPNDRSHTSILSPSRLLDSPDSAESHEFR